MKKYLLLCTGLLFLFSCDSNKTDCDTENKDTIAYTENGNMPVTQSGKRVNKFVPRPKTKYQAIDNGELIELTVDTNYGYLVNVRTMQPVLYFIDIGTNDTIFGPTGDVVNNRLMHDASYLSLDTTKYKVEDDEMKLKFGADGKIKVEKDEAKFKDGNGTKMKIEDDEMKIKTPTQKVKVEDDEMKIKNR